jgi:NTE family protein
MGICDISEAADNKHSQNPPKAINLALQGGGAHGAFTWGVLDRLFESELVKIDAISGTSAGAMNAVVAADGLMQDGNDGARKALEKFWKAVSRAALLSPVKRNPWDVLAGNWNLDNSPGFVLFDYLERLASPYVLNPLNINPLKELLAQQVNFERVRSCNKMQLFISATRVRNGQVKVFQRRELTPEAVMASACLPNIFQAVEVDGEAYWDGGYAGNPVLFPFTYHCTARDVIIVQINPFMREQTPQSAIDILDRVNEITFNSSLLSELRAIEFVARLLDEGCLDAKRYKKMLIHIIADEAGFKDLNTSSKLNAEWDFLLHLRELGRQAASKWLDANYESLGRNSTVDIRALLHR